METCRHFDAVHEVEASADGCEDCIKIGATWVHLRLCMTCGHVGCCDNSPNRHATRHYHSTDHPILTSFEPGEDWGWCYKDEMFLDAEWPIRGLRFHTAQADRIRMENASRAR